MTYGLGKIEEEMVNRERPTSNQVMRRFGEAIPRASQPNLLDAPLKYRQNDPYLLSQRPFNTFVLQNLSSHRESRDAISDKHLPLPSSAVSIRGSRDFSQHLPL